MAKKLKKASKKQKSVPKKTYIDTYDDMDTLENDSWHTPAIEDSDFDAPQGLTLGQRIGTIRQLETLGESNTPEFALKAGLKIRLDGSRILLTENGQALTIAELTDLAQWLLSEAEKAMEAYEIDI